MNWQNADIAIELIKMAQHDLSVREELLKEGKLSLGYNPDMECVHKKNAARLEEIINSIGYPTKSRVGEEASDAAWLIIQHAISEPVFMKRCFALLSESAGNVNPQNLAYMYDRICYFEGRPQKYGTQFDGSGIYPVEDLAEMTRLRTELQMNELAEDLIIECKESDPKIDLHANDKNFYHWRKKVGWI